MLKQQCVIKAGWSAVLECCSVVGEKNLNIKNNKTVAVFVNF